MADERRYRTEIPNIIDDLGLDPHERALYVHYKRACGGNDCEWVESIRVTAQRTKMSVGRASEARKSLVERGLIRLISKGNDGTAVRAVNIWDLNTLFYQQEYRPDIDGWKVEQLREWCEGVHIMNTLEQEELPDSQPKEVGVQDVNGSVHNMKAGVHNMNNKKEPIKKEPKELLPKGNGAVQPPLVILPEEIPEPEEPIPEENLLPDSPELLLLFDKVNRNRKLRNWGPAKQFSSIEQKQSFQKSASRLGAQEFEAGVTKGLKKGITNLSGLVNWLETWGTKGNKGGRQNGQKTTRTGESGIIAAAQRASGDSGE